jgi:hypothetical protein
VGAVAGGMRVIFGDFMWACKKPLLLLFDTAQSVPPVGDLACVIGNQVIHKAIGHQVQTFAQGVPPHRWHRGELLGEQRVL